MTCRIKSFLVVFAVTPLIFSSAVGVELPKLWDYEAPSLEVLLDSPVEVFNRQGRLQLVVGRVKEGLRIAFPDMPGAEMVLPHDAQNLYLSVKLPSNYDQIKKFSADGKHSMVLRGLQNLGPSSLPFLDLPEERSNLASVAEMYYRALVDAAPIDEAILATLQMPFEEQPGIFAALERRLAYRAMKEGAWDGLEMLIARRFEAGGEAEYSSFGFAMADLIRATGQQSLAGKIYGTMATSDDPDLRQRSLLWAVYSYAVLEDVKAANSLLETLEAPDYGSPNLVHYCLAMGRLAMLEDDAVRALELLSRAMVLASIEESFKPEIYFLLSRAYLMQGDLEAARGLGQELSIFYPDNSWLVRMREEWNEQAKNQPEY